MKKIMVCKEAGCNGEIDQGNLVSLRVGCGPAYSGTYPCRKCGRLHWESDGSLVFNRGGSRAFLSTDKIVLKNEDDQIVFTF